MSYNKHKWVNNVDAVDEDKMNHIENGIANLDVEVNNFKKIENKLKTYFIPTNIGGVQGWHLVASGSISTYNNNAFKLSVMDVFSKDSGILYANIRRDDGALRIDRFLWETNTGIKTNEWKIRTDGNNYYLYCYLSPYAKYQIRVIQASSLGDSNEDILTFYTPTASDIVPEPTGTNPEIYESLGLTSYLTDGTVRAFKIGNIVIVEIHGSMQGQIPNAWTDYPIAKLNIQARERMTTTIVDQSTGLCADAYIDSNSDTIYINKRASSSITGDWLRGQLVFIAN